MCGKMSKESYSCATVKSKDKKEATECQPINRRCSAASFFVVLLGFVLEVVLSGSTVMTHDAVKLRESKVAVIVTVREKLPLLRRGNLQWQYFHRNFQTPVFRQKYLV